MECIICHSHRVGSVAKNRYFCSDCCVEFKISTGKPNIYHVGLEGDLFQCWVRGGKCENRRQSLVLR